MATPLKFKKRKKLLSSLVYVLHKTWNWAFSSRSRVVTAKKCTKKRDARANLLFCLINLLLSPSSMLKLPKIYCTMTDSSKLWKQSASPGRHEIAGCCLWKLLLVVLLVSYWVRVMWVLLASIFLIFRDLSIGGWSLKKKNAKNLTWKKLPWLARNLLRECSWRLTTVTPVGRIWIWRWTNRAILRQTCECRQQFSCELPTES